MSTSDEDPPQIGARVGGMVLVCHGDDWPVEFADWQEPLVDEFNKLEITASEFGLDLDPQDGSPPIEDVTEFCERLGIEFDTSRWEGSLISGIYHWGWIREDAIGSAVTRGHELLRSLHKNMNHHKGWEGQP